MADELRKPIKWDRPCHKCGSHYCDLSCPDLTKNEERKMTNDKPQKNEMKNMDVNPTGSQDWSSAIDAAMKEKP